jgi:hypothetical protein
MTKAVLHKLQSAEPTCTNAKSLTMAMRDGETQQRATRPSTAIRIELESSDLNFYG